MTRSEICRGTAIGRATTQVPALQTASYLTGLIIITAATLVFSVLVSQRINQSKWYDVVLQEQSQSPVGDPTAFMEYASRLDKEIRSPGGQTILFMT